MGAPRTRLGGLSGAARDGLRGAVTSREPAAPLHGARTRPGREGAAAQPRGAAHGDPAPHQTGWSQECVSGGEPKLFIWLRRALLATESILNPAHSRRKLQDSGKCAITDTNTVFIPPGRCSPAPKCHILVDAAFPLQRDTSGSGLHVVQI